MKRSTQPLRILIHNKSHSGIKEIREVGFEKKEYLTVCTSRSFDGEVGSSTLVGRVQASILLCSEDTLRVDNLEKYRSDWYRVCKMLGCDLNTFQEFLRNKLLVQALDLELRIPVHVDPSGDPTIQRVSFASKLIEKGLGIQGLKPGTPAYQEAYQKQEAQQYTAFHETNKGLIRELGFTTDKIIVVDSPAQLAEIKVAAALLDLEGFQDFF